MPPNPNDFDSHRYWEERHSTYGIDFRDVGDKRISSAKNRIQLVGKASHLLWLLGRLGVERSAHLLDAGCGKGFITETLACAGFQCVGVDVSDSAIRNSPSDSDAQYHVAPLESFVLNRKFDVVICADVLYHLVDDNHWSNAVSNLVRHLDFDGVLVVVEAFIEDGRTAPHVRWRNLTDYRKLAKELGVSCRVVDTHVERYSQDTKTLLEFRHS